MPNPGSHFLFHRRLLWNSSSMANVTTRREIDRRENTQDLLTAPSPFSFSLPFLCASTLSFLCEAKQSQYTHDTASSGSATAFLPIIYVCESILISRLHLSLSKVGLSTFCTCTAACMCVKHR